MMRHRPLLLMALGFMAGILIAQGVGMPPVLPLGCLGLSCLLLALSPRRLVPAVVLLGAALGALRLTAFYGDPAQDVAARISPVPVRVTGRVVGEPTVTPGGLNLFLAATVVDEPAGRYAVTGSVAVHAGRHAFDAQSLPAPGDTLRLTGTLQTPLASTNPGGYDARGYLARRAVDSEMRVVRTGGVQVLTEASGPPRWASVADLLAAAVEAHLPGASAGLVRGVLLGQRRALPPALLTAFAATGTAHLLATAGLHVGILAWWLERLCARLRCPRRGAALLIMAVLIAYLALTGGRPAAARAVLTACLYYGAVLLERAPDLPTSLAAAALGILGIQPTALLEADFQLSFTTVLALALAMPMWEDLWRTTLEKIGVRAVRRAARIGIDVLGVSLIAPLASAPLTAYYFNQWSLVSLPANLIVVPLAALLLPLGCAAMLIALIMPGLGAVAFTLLVAPLAQAILSVTGFFAALPGASVSVASPPAALIIGGYALFGGLLGWARFRQLGQGPAWRNSISRPTGVN